MYQNYRISKRGLNNSPLPDYSTSDPQQKKLTFDQFKSSNPSSNLRYGNSKYSRVISPDHQRSIDSFDSKYRNKSFVHLDSTASKVNKLSLRSNRLKSLKFRQDLDRKYKVPNFIAASIIEIFVNTSKDPFALGLLIAPKLVMTSHPGIPNERFAQRCVFRFISDKSHFRPRTDKFFYSSLQYNLSVLAISRVRKETTTKQHPVRLEPAQVLKLGDILFCAESNCFRVQLSNLDSDNIGISSHFTPLTGSPIFSSSWNLIGIANTTSMTYKYTECITISNILQVLAYIRSRYNFAISPVEFEKTQDFKESKEMKWFEFSGEYVEVFNIEKNEWDYYRSQYEILWHCAFVSISDDETLMIGGLKKELAVDFVYKYNSSSNQVVALASMGVARAYSAAVFYDNLVFAIGGKYANTFCEKFLIEENRWEYIPPMLHERFEHSAIVLNHSIYVIGGEPRRFIGNSIEKFDILREMWEDVPTKLPFPISCPPICVIDSFSCGILGGRGSRIAVIMEVSKYHSNDVSFKQGAELSEEIESIYPAAYSKEQSKIFILNTAEGFARPLLYKVHSSYLPL